MPAVFEAEAEEDEAGDHEGRGEVHCCQARFGFEVPVVAGDVAAGD